MRSARFRQAASCLICLLAAEGAARAALPGEGQEIRTNDYSIDLYQGPVLSANRVTGLAGAFVAIADGVEGSAMNPAATAARVPYSYGHFDYDLGVGITFPSAIQNTDFWNSGHRTELPKSKSFGFLFFNLALQLQFGAWGFGLSTDFQQYSLLRGVAPADNARQDRLAAQVAIGHVQVAHSFLDGQLLLGLGLRTTGLSVKQEGPTSVASSEELFSTVGVGLEGGMIWQPTDWPIRFGAAYRGGFNTRASPESTFVIYPDDPINRLYLPTRVTLPWDLNVGFAAQMGPRPLNPRWFDPSSVLQPMRRYLEWRAHERERRLRLAEEQAWCDETRLEHRRRLRKLRAELRAEEDLDERERARVEKELVARLRKRYHQLARSYVLVSTSLMISGTVDNAVGIESMLDRTVQRSGQRLSISPHLGLETEIVPNWLRIRGGAYVEPSRFDSNQKGSRLHATFGFDAKLFAWDVFGAWPPDAEWRFGASIDAARSYLSGGIAVGLWH